MGRHKSELPESYKPKIAIGSLLQRIAREQHMSVRTITAKTGYQRANIYRIFNKTVMEDHEVDYWADVLEVPRDTIYQRWVGIDAVPAIEAKLTRDELLDKVVSKQTEIEQLKTELFLKDAQIKVLKEILIGSPEKTSELVNQLQRLPQAVAS